MKKSTSKPDANQTAHQVVQQTVEKHSEPLPAGLEAAWAAWSAGVGKVDQRAMLLLRAAFEAGFDAGGNDQVTSEAASAFGRKGGLVGGKVRAASLSKERRQAIAKKAAAKRWESNREQT